MPKTITVKTKMGRDKSGARKMIVKTIPKKKSKWVVYTLVQELGNTAYWEVNHVWDSDGDQGPETYRSPKHAQQYYPCKRINKDVYSMHSDKTDKTSGIFGMLVRR